MERQKNFFEKIEQKIALHTNILRSSHPNGGKQRKYRK